MTREGFAWPKVPLSDDNPTCFACVIAKARPSPSLAVSLKPRAQRELQRLHFDLGFGNNSEHIFCLFVDDYSRKMWAEEVKTILLFLLSSL